MATFIIVDQDKDPLGPGEINAGGTISVSDSDVFIIDPSANANTTFEAASGSLTDFEIRIQASNTNSFDLNFNTNTSPDVAISEDVDISDVKIDAANAESITLTAGNNVSIEKFDGSDGADTVVIGDDFSTFDHFDMGDGSDTIVIGANANFNNHNLELRQGDNSLSVGPGLLAKDIKADDGNNVISIGDGAIIEDIDVKDGNNSITLGNGVTLKDIKTDNGDNTITIGDNLSMNNLDAGNGNDAIVIGNGATINDLKSDKGNDSITIGDGFVIDKLEAGDGDDFVRLGDDGTIISKLDGGKGDDRLSNGNEYAADASNFESVVCFASGTLIATPCGARPVDSIAAGENVLTADNGAQSVLWVGKRVCSASTLMLHPNLRPIRLCAGALGRGTPSTDLVVSPQHRILVRSRVAERMFGMSEVLVAAKQLLKLPGIEIAEDIPDVTYVHLLCEQHEIVYSNGAPSETLYPGTEAVKTFDSEARQEIRTLFPDLDEDGSIVPARQLVSGRRGRTLAERHLKNGHELLEIPCGAIASLKMASSGKSTSGGWIPSHQC